MAVHPTFLVWEIFAEVHILFIGNLNCSLQHKSCISAVAPLLLQRGKDLPSGHHTLDMVAPPSVPRGLHNALTLGGLPLLFKLVCKGQDSDSLRRLAIGDVFSCYWRLRDWRIRRVWQNGYTLSHKLSILQPIHSWTMVSMASSIILAKELHKTGWISLDCWRTWC
jgi:hypothetical protein